jgi:hypothetical protein
MHARQQQEHSRSRAQWCAAPNNCAPSTQSHDGKVFVPQVRLALGSRVSSFPLKKKLVMY